MYDNEYESALDVDTELAAVVARLGDCLVPRAAGMPRSFGCAFPVDEPNHEDPNLQELVVMVGTRSLVCKMACALEQYN